VFDAEHPDLGNGDLISVCVAVRLASVTREVGTRATATGGRIRNVREAADRFRRLFDVWGI
jgi:hypothetical protein